MSRPHVWVDDRRNLAEHLIGEALIDLSRRVYEQAECHPDEKQAETLYKKAHALQGRSMLTQVMQGLQAHPLVTRTVEDFDTDGWALNTPDGIVDLRTGNLRESDPAAMCAKATAVGPAGGAEPERWLQFLTEATGGNVELQRYLQKLVGYSLTGQTTEHVLAFIHGPTRTGKSTFIETIADVFAGYHESAASDTFEEARSGRHPADLAKLAGARLVTCSETKSGKAWDAQRVKSMTGGDRITARFMAENFFTYTPQFQIIIVGNHEPEIRDADDAMMRRLHIVPFEHEPPEPDSSLKDKLKREHPGILAWAIEGCLKWLDEGLAPPPCVVARTEQYRAEEDPVGQFLEERCVFGPEHTITRRELYVAWQQFCHEAGEQAGSLKTLKRRFKSKETEHGFTDARVDGARGYQGVALKTTEDFV